MPILSADEMSTVFVVGFPPDIKEREFQNLFMFASGFEGASLKAPEMMSPGSSCGERRASFEEAAFIDTGLFAHQGGMAGFQQQQFRQISTFRQQTIGFARFQRRQDALAARDHLNGRCIDAERGCVLKVEMAKKNLFIAPRKQSIHGCFQAGMGGCQPEDMVENIDTPPCDPIMPLVRTTRSLSLSIPGNPAPIDISLPNAMYSKDKTICEALRGPSSANGRSFSVANSGSTSPMYILGENPPCNTLYVGNLPLNADENELKALFGPCDGFRRLSFRNKPNGPMCFVEFEDVASARKAMDALYGTLLSSSTKGGIRLSFSKNPLGVRSSTPTLPTGIGSASMGSGETAAPVAEYPGQSEPYYYEGPIDIASFVASGSQPPFQTSSL